MAGFDNDVVYADNVDFSGGDPVSGQITANGQLLIGASTPPYLRAGTITAGSGISITNSAGGIQIDAAVAPSQLVQQGQNCSFQNFGVSLDTGVFTIAGADGTDLSSSNPAYITLNSNATFGETVLYTVTSNIEFDMSDMTGAKFGASGNAWSLAMPMYFGFIADDSDTNLQFCVSRSPFMLVAPTAGNIGAIDGPSLASKDYSIFLNGSGLNENLYNGNQVGFIGTFTSTKDASDIWTAAALTKKDGIGQFNCGRMFSYPTGQNGAAAGYYTRAVGAATDPNFATKVVNYMLNIDGTCTLKYQLENCNVAGAGAVVFNPTAPFVNDPNNLSDMYFSGWRVDSSASSAREALFLRMDGAESYFDEVYIQGGTAALTMDDIDTSDSYYFIATYPLWRNF